MIGSNDQGEGDLAPVALSPRPRNALIGSSRPRDDLPYAAIVTPTQRSCRCRSREQRSGLANPCSHLASMHQEIQYPESLAFVPLTDVQEHIRIVEQPPLGVLGEPCPGHVPTDLTRSIPKEMDLLVSNCRLDPQCHACNWVLAILVRFRHRRHSAAQRSMQINGHWLKTPTTQTFHKPHILDRVSPPKPSAEATLYLPEPVHP